MPETVARPFADPKLQPFGAEGIFCHPAAAATAVGNADAAYARLARAVGTISDVSVASGLLEPLQRSALGEAALSPQPANVLRPFAHLWRGKRVLELDADAGARTALLAEQARSVTAVSGSLSAARVARRRLRHAGHVEVVCADPESLPHGAQFDVVIAVGSIDAMAPADALAWLMHVRPWLSAGGYLLLGINNLLSPGTLGAAHARSLPFGQPRWARRGVLEMLSRVGLQGQRSYPVFPDLHHGRLVLTQEGALSRAEDLNVVLAEMRESIDTAAHAAPLQASLWPEIANNGLLLDLAPALMFAARAEPLTEEDDVLASRHDLAYGYATLRPKQLHKESILRQMSDGRQEIVRRRLYPTLRPAHGSLVQRLDDEAVPRGETLEQQLHVALETPGWSAASVARCLRPWAYMLGRHERERSHSARGVVAGHFIDVGPANLAVGANGRLEAFSLEWDLGEDVPLAWVMYRGLKRALQRQPMVAAPAAEEPLAIEPLLKRILGYLDVPLKESDVDALNAQERDVFGWLSGPSDATMSVWHAQGPRAVKRS